MIIAASTGLALNITWADGLWQDCYGNTFNNITEVETYAATYTHDGYMTPDIHVSSLELTDIVGDFIAHS